MSAYEEAKKFLKQNSLPKTSGRFRGVSIGEDKDGFYVYTHRARSSSYKAKKDIPDSIIKRIERTG